MFDVISLVLGLAGGVGAAGFVAHKWPSVFASKVDSGAVVVNSGLDKLKAEAVKVEGEIKAKL